MAQHDYDLANATGAAFRADLNSALAAILTVNSGATEPATRQAYMLWADTTAGQLKQRNAANNAWVVIGTLGSTNLGLVPNVGGTQANAVGSPTTASYGFQNDTNCGMYGAGTDVIGFTTNGTERARITAQGYLKASNNATYLGSTANQHELCSSDATAPVVVVRANSATFSNAALIVSAARNTTNSSFSAIRYDNTGANQSLFTVTDSGLIVSVGSYNSTTASAANLSIDLNGIIQRSTSSGIYKTDVQPVSESVVDSLLTLQPVRYRSLASNDNQDWSYYGLIAEEVAEVDPRLVHWGYREEDYEVATVEEQRYNEETEEVETVEVKRKQVKSGATLKPEGVQYDRIGVLALGLIQRHQQRIAELEDALVALEARIAALES